MADARIFEAAQDRGLRNQTWRERGGFHDLPELRQGLREEPTPDGCLTAAALARASSGSLGKPPREVARASQDTEFPVNRPGLSHETLLHEPPRSARRLDEEIKRASPPGHAIT